MSNTYRKDKNNKYVKEGLKKEPYEYKCNCWHCTGYDARTKFELRVKIAEKEMKEEVRVIETEENIDFEE